MREIPVSALVSPLTAGIEFGLSWGVRKRPGVRAFGIFFHIRAWRPCCAREGRPVGCRGATKKFTLTGASVEASPRAAFVKRLMLTVALAVGLSVPSAEAASLPQPIHFWGSIAAPVTASYNPVVIRPSTIGLFRDGSWFLEHLHWTGWGSSVARAKGISNASNGNPSQAQGKRIMTSAQVTLYNPGRFEDREVYRCFKLTVPPPCAHWTPMPCGRLCATAEHPAICLAVVRVPTAPDLAGGGECRERALGHTDSFPRQRGDVQSARLSSRRWPVGKRPSRRPRQARSHWVFRLLEHRDDYPQERADRFSIAGRGRPDLFRPSTSLRPQASRHSAKCLT